MDAIRRDPVQGRLSRTLCADAAAVGAVVTIRSIETRDWCSATFVGAQHRIVLACANDAHRRRWLAALAEADLPVPGHVVADVVIEEAGGEAVVLTILTLADD